MSRTIGLNQVIQKMGSASKLAEALGITPPAVHKWKDVPARHVHEIERLTGIPRSTLRPDLYPLSRERVVLPETKDARACRHSQPIREESSATCAPALDCVSKAVVK